ELNEEQSKKFYEHLESCEACKKSFRRKQRTLNLMSRRKRAEPDPQFWDGYWDRLQARMERQKQPVVISWRSWIYRAAAVMLLIGAGVIIGRMTRFGSIGPGPVANNGPKIQVPVQEVRLQQRTQEFLGRSEILLLGITHFDASTQDPAALDIP